MPRYELLDDKSTNRATGKSWEITLKGNVIETRTGRVGPLESRIDGRSVAYNDRGRPVARPYPDRAAALKKYEALIAAKQKAGYRLVEGIDPTTPRADTQVHRHPGLEAELAAAHDDATYLVYADWLESQGDPRSELIRVQHQMRARPDPVTFMTFKRRDEELRHAHGLAWLGAIVEECAYRVRLDWRMGFIDTARLDDRDNDTEVGLDALVTAVLACPAGCAVRKIVLRGGRTGETVDAGLAVLPARGLQKVVVHSRAGAEAARQLLEPHRARLEAANVAIEADWYERS